MSYCFDSDITDCSIKSAASVFHRQTTDYTCGPASCLTVAQMLSLNFLPSEQELACQLLTQPIVGTCGERLGEWCLEHLPVRAIGEGVYSGGLAIANIRHLKTGGGHYVVMLDGDGDSLTLYCPKENDIFTIKENDLDWRDGSGDLVNWAVDLNT